MIWFDRHPLFSVTSALVSEVVITAALWFSHLAVMQVLSKISNARWCFIGALVEGKIYDFTKGKLVLDH